MIRTVRDLALGLRPSMLDDFGLRAALEWYVRDVSRRYGVDVDLLVDGDVDALPEQHQTCVYRAVQEALTNCVRHAHARAIGVDVVGNAAGLSVSITDDGVGFDPAQRREGLGMRGLEERVNELGGKVVTRSAINQGTTITIHVPVPQDGEDRRLARIAG